MSENSSKNEFESKDDGDCTASNVTNVQLQLVGQLSITAENIAKKQEKQLEVNRYLHVERQRVKCQIADEFERNLKRLQRGLAKSSELADCKTYLLKEKLKKMMELYVKVNQAVKIESKEIVQMDQLEMAVADNQIEFVVLQQNLSELRPLLEENYQSFDSFSLVSRMKSYEQIPRANVIQNPSKPIEAEIFTYMSRIIREIFLLREHLQICPHIIEFTDPIIEQTKLVAEMMLEEFSVKSIDVFLGTLTPKERE